MSVLRLPLPVFKGIAICVIGDEDKLAMKSAFDFS